MTLSEMPFSAAQLFHFVSCFPRVQGGPNHHRHGTKALGASAEPEARLRSMAILTNHSDNSLVKIADLIFHIGGPLIQSYFHMAEFNSRTRLQEPVFEYLMEVSCSKNFGSAVS